MRLGATSLASAVVLMAASARAQPEEHVGVPHAVEAPQNPDPGQPPGTEVPSTEPGESPDAELPGAAQPSEPPPAPQAPAATSEQEPKSPEAKQKSSDEQQTELARLDAQLTQAETSVDETPPLSLYGFSDFSFYKYFVHRGTPVRGILYDNSAFAVGNLNVYIAGELGSGWNSLAEIRFTYLPNGSREVGAGGVTRTDTEVIDYTNFGRTRRTGGLFIERAWLQYTADPLLIVRGGSWLTPYGIWNEDHGSPTIIPVVRPYVVGFELMPERQTGLQVRGTGYPTEALSLGYVLAVSNGRGPVQEYADLDENKAVTARLMGTYRALGQLEFGVSGYYGRYTDISQSAVANGSGVRIVDDVVEQYDELSLGVDARYTFHGFHSQAEFIVNDRAYTEEGRPERTATTFVPDNRRLGGYLITGYRFGWLGLMPYVTGEYFSFDNTLEPAAPASQLTTLVAALGLNSRPTHNVTLKVEGTMAWFYGDIPHGSSFEHPLGAVQAQVAWAF
jgi:hypothetical protein